jgi:hypothetical protein
MRPMLFRYFGLLAIALAAFSAQVKARGAELTDADARQVQAVVAAQLQALAQDDAQKAFATATPRVRAEIGDADRFLELVRKTYPMVYRTTAIGFQKAEMDAGQVVQLVDIRDGDDKAWLAVFAMERQPDNSWKIKACLVAEKPGTPA